jgi:hypothetical protein
MIVGMGRGMNGVKNAAEFIFVFMDCWRCLSSSPANATNEHALSARTETRRLRGGTKSWAPFILFSFLKETKQVYDIIMVSLCVCVCPFQLLHQFTDFHE